MATRSKTFQAHVLILPTLGMKMVSPDSVIDGRQAETHHRIPLRPLRFREHLWRPRDLRLDFSPLRFGYTSGCDRKTLRSSRAEGRRREA